MATLIVIPTYNERESIESLIRALVSTYDISVLVVDDNSPDGTAELVEGLARTDARIFLLQRPRKMGLGTAYRDGFAWALKNSYSNIIQMDADGSHNPVYVRDFLDSKSEFDLQIGSRYVDGGRVERWPLRRVILSRWSNWYVRMILGVKNRAYTIRDSTGGFKCWSAAILKRMDLESLRTEGYGFQIEMNWRAVDVGAAIREIPIIFSDRTAGASKINRSVIFEAALLPWILRKSTRAGERREDA